MGVMMNYYLVCDAGGTKADFLLFRSDGRVLAKSRTTGANAIFLNPEDALRAVADGISDCLGKAGTELDRLARITLFIPGFKPCLPILKEKLQYENIDLQGDENDAFYGALGNGYGIVVLSGTGSFAMGKDSCGNEVTCGGWGPLFGDYGSGYHIGVLCLSELAMRYDMGQPDTILASEVRMQMKIHSIEELRKVAYQPDFTRNKVAELSRAVAKAAAKEDKTALDILDHAAKELARLAAMAAGRLPSPSQGLPVSLIGGITNMGGIITDRFRDHLALELPQAVYYPCKYEPIVGAALYVLEKKENKDIANMQIIKNLTGRG